MVVKETVLFLLLMMLPVAMEAKEPVKPSGTPHFLNTRNDTNTQDKYNFFGVIDIVHLITSYGLGSFNAKKTDKTKVLPECSESQNAVSFAE